MTIRPILLHPDARLKQNCAAIPDVSDDLRRLVDDMLQTMYDAPGIGLAAPQVGVLKRLFVMDCAAKDEPPAPLVAFNPEIIAQSDDMNTHNEGCLSLPELFEDITRPAEITLRYIDQNGAVQTRDFDGLWAVCAQHELDHLNGKLFIDHLSRTKRAMLTKKMLRYKKERQGG